MAETSPARRPSFIALVWVANVSFANTVAAGPAGPAIVFCMLGSRHPAPTHFHSPLLAPQTTAAGLGVPETQTRHGHGGFVLVRGACWEQAMVEVKAKARPTGSASGDAGAADRSRHQRLTGPRAWSFQSESRKVRRQADRWRPETAVTRALNSSIQRIELVRVRGGETTWLPLDKKKKKQVHQS